VTNIISPLVAQAEGFQPHKHDHKALPHLFKLDDASRMVVPQDNPFGGVAPLDMTDWAYSQLASRLGPTCWGTGSAKALPLDFLMKCDPGIRAEVFNSFISKHRGDQWVVRGYNDEVRAVLTARYVMIENEYMLKGLESALDEIDKKGGGNPWEIVRASVTPNSFIVRIIRRNVGGTNPTTGMPEWGVGAMLRNDEIGQGRVEVLPFIQRHSCQNSTVIDDEQAFSSQHRGDQSYVRDRLVYALMQAFNLSIAWLDKFVEAQSVVVDDFDTVLAGLGAKYGWNDAVKTAVAMGTENEHTKAGLINGVTYAAHTVPTLTPDETLKMERIGGAILASDGSLFAEATKLGAQYFRQVERQIAGEAHGQRGMFDAATVR
jgi:hypothetical protein